MSKVTLIAVCVALLCGVNAFSGGLAPVAPGAMLETARHTIPVSAEDAEEVALDQEVDTALHSVRTHDLLAGRVEAEQSFDAIDQEMGLGAGAGHWDQSNFDLSVPEAQDSESEHVGEDEALDEEEDVFVAERESVSVAVGEGETDGTSESVSVDAAEEDSTFLQIDEEAEEEEEDSEEDSEEEEEEEEEESEDESEEQDSLLESGSIVVHAESIEPEHAPRLSEAHVELVADAAAQSQALAAAGALSEAVVADEDRAHEAETEVQMVKVEDFDTQKLAETEQELVNPRAGPVSAGLRDKTIEASGVSAEAETVQPEVIALVADEDVRAAAGAALIQTGDVVHHEEDAEEQAQLDLLHSVLAELRASQGRDLNEPLTPADMDEIEARVANLVQIDATTTSASAAAADTETQAKAEAEHPRDHTVVAAVSPTVEAATPGAALKPVTIVGGEKKVVAPKPKYRYDVQYHADKRQFMPSQHVELTDKPNPLHARDPTAPSTLKNPVKPQVWKREFKRPNKPQYRYDVQYEKRAQCCRGREACCVRGVQTKTIPAKVKKAVRVVPPTKKADSKKKKVSADKKKVAPKQYRWDVEYERQRVQQCCGAKRACCRAPTAMYRADVQYEAEPNWFVLSGSGERAVVVGDDELSMLQRIQNRQRLLHKLLLTHDSPLYDDLHWQAASDEHIVQFHEPAAARVIGYGPDGDLTRAEAEELQNWLTQLPVVPHLAVVEVQAHTIQPAADNAEDASFLAVDETAETVRPLMKPARVLKGFVDVEQEPSTLSKLIAALPPTPLVAQNVGNEEEEEMEIDISELDV